MPPSYQIVAVCTIASAAVAFTPVIHRCKGPIGSLRQTYDDDDDARSQFGTKQYWEDMYAGMGDFPSDEYSWYYGWDSIKPHFVEATPDKGSKILVPGVGNDSMLLDLYGSGYKDLTAFDYSPNAIERQEELLTYDTGAARDVKLSVEDARELPRGWTASFDAILEKGALDAVYLSGDGNVERAATEFGRVLRKGGICVSISGVVPEELRRETLFPKEEWEWLRDGSEDLKAGCFVWKKL
mmetsp:Transcript_8275/g.17522  ORF Transcript_8275/g.17522 Transcript_8275/m.17522 type:complete len:240 (-) Transcript_8275:204-923(-)|eukprot:CAMPEP_0183302732 /NCGR_PEP_ID=MMETSP0160_2-20130417/8414_1 /TAXON_ID=2839 ORGANISM="Odontella Sinensis, Strain Grunow 1884" /NCGR_SAMPLE_ID=MMETSP0160_2 /ASSEMBLY_ACC=CAM_ASM_000250 /LENGTH=239 /DNA_ID=CAMNT_0025465539 /DNA_START=32 /DNA_END=751 /DNA_ORIENTATION=+